MHDLINHLPKMTTIFPILERIAVFARNKPVQDENKNLLESEPLRKDGRISRVDSVVCGWGYVLPFCGLAMDWWPSTGQPWILGTGCDP